jgi:glycosyltransferase involved in cell wall biosynthesis
MRVAFDGTTLTPGRTGVGYYTQHLLQHLAREVERSGDELIVVSNQPIDSTIALPAHVGIHDRLRFPLRIGWMQALAPRVLKEVGADVVHFTNGMLPPRAPAATVVTIHDMSLRLFPRCHPLRRRLINRPLIGVAARRADAIVTVSHSARRDLLRFHRVAAERVTVVYEAAGPQFMPMKDPVQLDAIRARYKLPARFVLYVGTIEPRKNLTRIVDAFCAARAAGAPHDLVCAGPYGWASRDLSARIERLGLRGVVRFIGYVPVADLPLIYNASEFFVFPSLYEGFGLPVVEAMACGTPVITSRTSSLGEIANGAALTVDPEDTGAIAEAIHRLSHDGTLRDRLAEQGRARAGTFSWQRTAREMLSVYRRAAGLGARTPAPAADPLELPERPVAVEQLSREISS